MKIFRTLCATVAVSVFLILPVVSHADSGLVFCNQSVDSNGKFVGEECGWSQLVGLVARIIKYLTVLSIPLAAIGFAWAGFKVMSAGGSMKGRDEAKKIFESVATGLFFILAAWLIVNTILIALVGTNSEYSLL